MQKDFLDSSLAFVPNTNSRYFALVDKGLFTSYSAPCSIDGQGLDATVTIATVDGEITVKRILAIALAFKNCRVPPRFWYRLDVGFVDGNLQNEHPSNLIILFPKGGIEYPDFRGWCYIPMYTRYLIHRDGRVFDTRESRFINILTYGEYPSTKLMAGYKFISVNDDTGKHRSANIHRLLCLAFKGFPVNVDQLDVNHKDAQKSNNVLDNLEWVTRTVNNLHATEMGARPDNHAVVIKSIYTGEERKYFSLWECARALNVHGELIRYRCLTEGQQPFPPGLLFKKLSCEKPWPDLKDTDGNALMNEGRFQRAYICTDTKTGTSTRFSRGVELVKFLGIAKESLVRAKGPEGDFYPYKPEIKEDRFRYHVQVVTFEDECKSLFAEKQKSYLS